MINDTTFGFSARDGYDTDHPLVIDPLFGFTRDTGFPITPGVIQTVHGQTGAGFSEDVFVTRLNAVGSVLVFSTSLGGPIYDRSSSIAVNSAEENFVAGWAQSGFPTSPGAYRPQNAGSYDLFVLHLLPDASGHAQGGSTSLPYTTVGVSWSSARIIRVAGMRAAIVDWRCQMASITICSN